MSQEEFPSAEQSQAMIHIARETIDQVAVGIVDVGSPPKDDFSAFRGSGTLVQSGGTYGVLTAAHVVRHFVKKTLRRSASRSTKRALRVTP